MRLQHDGQVDYVHEGHLHAPHEGHYDEHVIPVGNANPDGCSPVTCACGHQGCGHEQVPHGDHTDYLFQGHLHHQRGDHCADHGAVSTL
jgi:hypothetical protein